MKKTAWIGLTISGAVILAGLAPKSAWAVRSRTCLNELHDPAHPIKKHIVVISGTDRAGSNTLKISKHTAEQLKTLDVEVDVIDLRELPAEVRSPDVYDHVPESFNPYMKKLQDADGVIVVTPEYNGSFPGILKTFIDVVSLKDRGVLTEMPIQFMGVAAGQFAGSRSIDQLSTIFRYCEANVYNKQALFPHVDALIKDREGGGIDIIDEATKKHFEGAINGFVDHIP